ncbi:MAG TPA: hypothetical protein VL137_10545 [Polyangiaceae bacterium]|nr:hypothetical protein [Polyangiaceae bacterium]
MPTPALGDGATFAAIWLDPGTSGLGPSAAPLASQDGSSGAAAVRPTSTLPSGDQRVLPKTNGCSGMKNTAHSLTSCSPPAVTAWHLSHSVLKV